MTDYPQLDAAADLPRVTLQTTLGDIELVLFPEQAPLAVENFLTHAENGYYDQQHFHRVIPNFMVQGGDPEGTGMGGQSIWGKPFEDEFSNQLYNFRGALSMANAGPNTNGSQFFIVQAPEVPERILKMLTPLPEEVQATYREAGGTPWLDGRHTVFGQVLAGMDVVDAMTRVKTNRSDQPKKPIVIKKVVLA
ncbi:peptidylprolyl isomerase [Leuconostocaceae bacterium ESL0958]|nr:peptidylprolyl isomerase [Leuconostocaceae bacterium ESL0958]